MLAVLFSAMRSSSKNKTVRKVRGICRLTQQELADMVGCARLSITGLEHGRLRLSESMAERMSLHTGVSKAWLLSNDPERVAVCERDPQRPFTPEVFWMTRAEVKDPRTDPIDVVMIQSFLSFFYGQLNAAAWNAYECDEMPYFYMCVRGCLKELEDRWPAPISYPQTSDAAKIQAHWGEAFEKLRLKKLAQQELENKPEAPTHSKPLGQPGVGSVGAANGDHDDAN